MNYEVQQDEYRFGPFHFDSSGLLFTEGKRIPLEPLQADVLKVLLKHGGRVVTKAELIEQAWRGGDVSDESISRAIYRLRRALGNRKDEYIEAVSGRGYRFVPVVEGESRRSRPMQVTVRAFTAHPADLVCAEALCGLIVSMLQGEGISTVAERRWPSLAGNAAGRSARFEVSGRLHLEGRLYRPRIQLARTADSSEVWEETFAASAAELSDVARKIARRIADSVRNEEGPKDVLLADSASARGLLNTARALANDFSAMLGYWDLELRCQYANPAYEVWFGRSQARMLGISMQELLGSMFALNLPYIRGAKAGQTQYFKRSITLPDGSVRASLASYFPDFRDGKVQGFSALVVDAEKFTTG